MGGIDNDENGTAVAEYLKNVRPRLRRGCADDGDWPASDLATMCATLFAVKPER